MFEKFPYTDLHNLNLDWVITTLKDIKAQIDNIGDTISDIINKAIVDALTKVDFSGVGSPLEKYGADGDPLTDTEALEKVAIESEKGVFVTIAEKFRNFTKTVIKTVIAQPAFNSLTNGGRFNFLHGTRKKPTTDTNPEVFAQKIIYDISQRGNPNSHKLGCADFECEFHGSGGDVPNDGGFVGATGACVGIAENQGTSSNPNWDLRGPVIGLQGYAETQGYNAGVTTAMWANVVSSDMTQAQIDAVKNGSLSSIGLEVNCWMRHPDQGYRPYLTGMGNVVGVLLNNYQEYGSDTPAKKDWTFGIVMGGTPITGDYTSNDNDDWNGYHTAILIDKVTNKGIVFGGYVSDGAVMIDFPENYAIYKHRPKAAIRLGDNRLNMGNYYGAESVHGDLLKSGNNLLYHRKADEAINTVLCCSKVKAGTGEADRLVTIHVAGEEIQLLGKYNAPDA